MLRMSSSRMRGRRTGYNCAMELTISATPKKNYHLYNYGSIEEDTADKHDAVCDDGPEFPRTMSALPR